MNHLNPTSVDLLRDAAQARLAVRVASRLNEGATSVPHDIAERLRVAREQAVQRAAAVRRAAAPAVAVHGQAGGAAVLSGPPSMWLRLASVLPLLVLVAGLVLVQHHQDAAQIAAAAEVDAALLADELPPEAYTDPGFAEFLKAAPPAP